MKWQATIGGIAGRLDYIRGAHRGNHNANKTHCANGHPYSGNNVALRLRSRDGYLWVERRCVECRRKQRRGSGRSR